MSEPSIQNIDKWLFEFYEGNLSPHQEQVLKDYLEIHPELAPDMDAWSSASISPVEHSFDVSNLTKSRPKIVPILFASFSVISVLSLAGIYLFNTNSKIDSLYSENKELGIKLESQNDRSLLASNTNERLEFNQTSSIAESDNDESNNVNEALNSQFGKANTPQQINVDRSFVAKKEENIAYSTSQKSVITVNETSLSNEKMQSPFAEVIASLQKEDKDTGGAESERKVSQHNSQGSDIPANELAEAKSDFSKKEFSLKSSFYEFSRSASRIMNNPVALKNYRDVYYSIPMQTGYNSNPAMAGTQVTPKIQASSRAQFINTSSQKIENRLSFDSYISELKGGIGVDLTQSTIGKGAIQNMEMAFTYSPKISLGNFSIEPAVRLKIGNKKIDENKLSSGSVIEMDRGRPVKFFNQGETPTGKNLWYRDVQLGFLFNTPWFYAGASIDNISRHYNNIYSNEINKDFSADRHYNVQIGTDYKSLSKRIKFSAYVLHQGQGAWKETWLGANFNFKGMHVGAALNDNFNPAFSLGLDSKRVRFIYNVDVSVSSLDFKNYVSHQLTLRVKFKPNRNARRILNL